MEMICTTQDHEANKINWYTGESDTVYVILDAYINVPKKDFTDFFHPRQVC